MKMDSENSLAGLQASLPIEQGVVDALTSHIAVLDTEGRIVMVNRGWQDFAVANSHSYPVTVGVGSNYLDVCDRSKQEGSDEAARFAEGIRAVIDGSRQHFELEYACHSPEEQRWFIGRVTRFGAGSSLYIVVTHENITSRKLAEMTLHESENRYRSIFEFSPLPMWVVDEKTYSFLAVNQAAVEHYGYSEEEFLGMTVLDVLIPEEMPQFLTRFAHNYTAIKPGAARHRKKDETIIEVEIRSHRLHFNGRTARLGTFTDVTERNRAKQELEDKNREIMTSWESMTDGFFAVDTQWRFTHLNSQAAFMLQRQREELLGKKLWDKFPEAIDSVFYQEYHRAVEQQVKVNFEAFYPPLNAWREVHAYPSAIGLSVYFRDITERKQAEEERERFFTLSLDMLAIISSDGYFKRLNPAFEATLGFSNVELMAKPFLEFVHPDDITATLAEVANLESGGHVILFENRYICRDGSYKWMRWMCAPYEDLWYCVAHDVTAIKEGEAALQKANDELESRVLERTAALEFSNRQLIQAKEEAESANRSKSEFLSRMSHELRTPLNAILGFGQILDKEGLTTLQKESVRYILKGGRHLLDLINEILDLARVESGQIELSIEPVSVAEVVQESCTLVSPLAALGGIRLLQDLSLQKQTYVLADRQRLKQALINILSNGIKYNHSGGRVEVCCLEGLNDRVCIAVRDTGPGIAPEDLPKLFTPFERLGAANSDIEGTGLGLVVSRQLITAMGGSLEVESQRGQGSTFSIGLPCAALPAMTLADLAERRKGEESRKRPESDFNVLCIEDNLSNLRLLEVILTDRPEVTLLAAMQGSVGLDLARQQKPDLILLDLHLPDMSGKEVLARLQQSALTSSIPVIIVSADATSPQRERLLSAGAKAYLTKPLDVAEFLKVLDQTLQAGGLPHVS